MLLLGSIRTLIVSGQVCFIEMAEVLRVVTECNRFVALKLLTTYIIKYRFGNFGPRGLNRVILTC